MQKQRAMYGLRKKKPLPVPLCWALLKCGEIRQVHSKRLFLSIYLLQRVIDGLGVFVFLCG